VAQQALGGGVVRGEHPLERRGHVRPRGGAAHVGCEEGAGADGLGEQQRLGEG
jgi:hypothetical protein